jgi:hypothetical protein
MMVTLGMSLMGTPTNNMSYPRKSENKHWRNVARGVASYLVRCRWMKWTPEEKKKAFDEYRKNAGIVPHGKQVAETTMSAGTSRSDTRQSVAYVPKPTHNPNVAVQQ